MKFVFIVYYFLADKMFDYQPISRRMKKLKYCRINGIPFKYSPTKDYTIKELSYSSH